MLACRDWNEHAASFELLELSVIVNAHQSCLIDLRVLLEQRVAGSAQLRRNWRSVKTQSAKMSTAMVAARRSHTPIRISARQAVNISLSRQRNNKQHE